MFCSVLVVSKLASVRWLLTSVLSAEERLSLTHILILIEPEVWTDLFLAVIEVKSDASLEEALEILSSHHIYSAPVPDVQAAAESSWMEKYLGMVDFAGIIHWLLNQVNLERTKVCAPPLLPAPCPLFSPREMVIQMDHRIKEPGKS